MVIKILLLIKNIFVSNIGDGNMKDISRLHIELHSQCNLKCNFCINKFRDNYKNRIEMSDLILQKIYNEIPEMTGLKIISLQLYNQPILNNDDIVKINSVISNIKSLSTIKTIKYRMSSNITMSKQMKYSDIIDVDVDEFYLTRYRSQNPTIEELISNLPNVTNVTKIIDGLFIYYWIKFNNNNKMKTIHYQDFSIYNNDLNLFNENNICLSDKGGLLKEIPSKLKTTGCYKKNLAIAYNGKITGCCEIYANMDSNSEYIIGDCSTDTIKNIVSTNKATDFYISINYPALFPEPCRTCTSKSFEHSIDDAYNMDILNKKYKELI